MDDGGCVWVVEQRSAEREELVDGVVGDEQPGIHFVDLARGELVAVGPLAPGVERGDAVLKGGDGFGVGEQGLVKSLTPLFFAQVAQAAGRLRSERPGRLCRRHGLIASERRHVDVLFSDGDRRFQDASLAAFGGGELLVERVATFLRGVEGCLGGGDGVVERSRVLRDGSQLLLGCPDPLLEAGRALLFAFVVVPCSTELLDGAGAEGVEPVRDLTARVEVAVLAGEGAALGGGGGVGAVDVEDGVENVAGFGDSTHQSQCRH